MSKEPTVSFELLFQTKAVRIFTAHFNSRHKVWIKHLRKNDYVVFSDVSLPGNCDQQLGFQNECEFPENIIFLANSPAIARSRSLAGVKNSLLINQNAFLDETFFQIDQSQPNEFDAIYNARPRKIKRHYLAKKVGEERRLALIVGQHAASIKDLDENEFPRHKFINEYQLQPTTVSRLVNQASCGLMLSDFEGGCFSSSEYLLCGRPVVSTESNGGRDFWYDDYNSIICEPNEEAVLAAVDEFVKNPRDPYKIRETVLSKMVQQREKFISSVLQDIFDKTGEVQDARTLFEKLNFRRYLVFQKKESWKSLEEVIHIVSCPEEKIETEHFSFGGG